MSEEYIAREVLNEELKKAAAGYPDFGHIFDIVRERVKRVPAADVEPVVHAHWDKCELFDWKYFKCTNCGETISGFPMFPYCPNCGAHMDEGSEEQ